MESEATLVQDPEPDLPALLAGDPGAFERLVRAESARLFRIIHRIVNDDNEAENLVQETFLQAFQRRHTFRHASKFTTWVYAIGINLARASLRKSRRFSPLDEEAMDRMQPTFAEGFWAEGVGEWDPHVEVERNERTALVRDAIRRLPDDYRTVVTLRDIEEVSTEDAARMLGITSGALRVRLHRARQALRALLEPSFQ